jgi:hypothetical protein
MTEKRKLVAPNHNSLGDLMNCEEWIRKPLLQLILPAPYPRSRRGIDEFLERNKNVIRVVNTGKGAKTSNGNRFKISRDDLIKFFQTEFDCED